MYFRNPIFLDADTWAQLKTLAGSELRTPRNFLRLLVRRAWEARQSTPAEIVPKQPVPGVSPTIPAIFHIRQGK